MTRTDKLTLTISFLALIVSAGSFYFSWYSYNKSNIEDISIIATPNGMNYKTYLSPNSSILPVEWVAIISNNGDKTSSIVNYSINQIRDNGNEAWFAGLDQGVFDESYRPLSFPIDIESGKSKKIILRVGIWQNSSVRRIFHNAGFDSKSIKAYTLRDTLFKHSIDLYGNKVEAQFLNDSLFSAKWPDGTNTDLYKLSLKTARRFNFDADLTLYPTDK
jgi:hypothetical protein